ncbi:hypothetical protein KI387_027490 [Taxus chinensis]|uniref:Bifunctional inhibitor/plant lipid transfer protein/seed storage helical domain-containing protein n=1 Tax=Taxus chinensis TaxID=29808 RepID=A0AA38L920_TAXCH|nr:hypothetical protein KI387_027490 [Taxus chinensis]
MAALLRGYEPLLAAIMGALVFIAATGTDSVMAQPPAMGCTDPIVSLSPCLSYMTGETKVIVPRDGCCRVLAAVITGASKCLCDLFANNDFLGFPINQTLARSLPAACNLLFPRQIEQCRGSNPAPPDALNLPSVPVRSPDQMQTSPTRSDTKKVGRGSGALFRQSLFGILLGSILTGILTVSCFLSS